MHLKAIQIGIWHYRAVLAHQYFLRKQLSKEGTFSCPRTILLQYFSAEDFSFLCQSKNKTFYKLQKHK